jgi:predicted dehydrogenase
MARRLTGQAQGAALIRVGIVGCNYGRTVLLPAFRIDPRCEVVALAGTDAARTAGLARDAGVPQAFGDWAHMIEQANIDAVAIATPPRVQPGVALAALKAGKAVFGDKPMAADLESATAMLRQAVGKPTAIDFGFPELPAWRKAKAMIDAGAIGSLRHAVLTWNVENYATKMRLMSWKTNGADGGGALGNFVSHSFYYLEWLCGPITGLSARLTGLPDAPQMETNAALALSFQSGATGTIAMSSASYLGSGHRLEIYGEDGTLVLANTTTDYMRGFTLSHARRPGTTLTSVAVDDDPIDKNHSDGRVAAVARLAARFFDAIEQRGTTKPGFAEGHRVQVLLDIARRSHTAGRFVTIGVAA